MANQLLGWFKFPVGDGAFYALFGLIFVILGITLLVLIFMGLGAVMKRVNARKKKGATKGQENNGPAAAPREEGVSPEVVVAITAALMAYYEEEHVKCDFVVKRIKRI